jgi:hypothetical protein
MNAFRGFGLWALTFVSVVAAFVVGHWTGRLRASLTAETAYPWDLQRKIARADITCGRLVSAPRIGGFLVESVDSGSVLVVVHFDSSKQLVTASALDSTGGVATDSWIVECEQQGRAKKYR